MSKPLRFSACLLATVIAVGACGATPPSVTPSPVPAVTPGAATPTPRPTVAPSVAPSPTLTASPSPTPIYEDLSGIVTTADLAHRYPIAVMLDDAPAARPQSGLADASVVWQAPVEGGIPRYMAVYQSGQAPSIGPVRSARLYFVRWAAEWRSLYLHAGGPPPLKLWLRGSQRQVVNADGKKTRRVAHRRAPHNLYSTGRGLRTYAASVRAGDDDLAYDPTTPGRLQPFRDGAAETARGKDGAKIRFTYTSERVAYEYDRPTNTWLRSVDGRAHHEAGAAAVRSGGTAKGPRIAPTTVIVMLVPIRRSSRIDGPALGRLEADSIGSNRAWIFADGKLVTGRWKKKDPTSRTRFVDASGAEIVLPRGQIFIQVIARSGAFDHSVAAAD